MSEDNHIPALSELQPPGFYTDKDGREEIITSDGTPWCAWCGVQDGPLSLNCPNKCPYGKGALIKFEEMSKQAPFLAGQVHIGTAVPTTRKGEPL